MSRGEERSPGRAWLAVTLLLITAAAVAHVAYLACDCPLDLAPDEAHYWDWSRHLDWSYYSKGPLVAYLIRGGCALAGEWSRALVHSDMAAVRLPAVVCGSLLLLSLYTLTVQVYGRPALGFLVVLFALTSPVIAAGSSLMTIDAPYTCCWGWALVLGHRALFRPARWVWPALGLVIGLGILAKYTMVLWLLSAGCYLAATPRLRGLLLRPGVWVATATVAICCLPILVWNLQHDWVTLKHVGGQAGVRDGGGIHWARPLVFVGTQFALLLGFWFVAWAAAMTSRRPWRSADDGVRYLWWMSAPTFCFFLFFSLKTHEEPNWAVTAYLSGLVLATAWVVEQLYATRLTYRRLAWSCLGLACGVGVAATVFVHRADWLQPVLLRLSGPATAERPLPLRRLDPSSRLRGWRCLAAAVDQLRDELAVYGEELVLAGHAWTVPGELGFYCRGNPVVYSLGLGLGDRHSQYDLWRPNPISDPASFRGRTFLFVGDPTVALSQAFETVETVRNVEYCEKEQPVARWTICLCRGFRGFQTLGDRPF